MAPEPFAQERFEQIRTALLAAREVALVGDQPLERVLERRARYAMLGRHPAPGRILPVGERHQHDPLDPGEAVPHGLMGVPRLGQRKVDGRRRGVLGRAGRVEHVVKVVGKQDGALRVPAGEHEQLVNGAVGVKAGGGEQGLHVARGLVAGQHRQLERPGLTVERTLPIREQRSHQRNAAEAGADDVEFVKGYIEEVPLGDESVDVVISNCVINLSIDKPRVIMEAARVLPPGGRLAVSDVIADEDMDEPTRSEMASFTGCIAGALTRSEFEAALAQAGFTHVEIRETHRVHPTPARP